MQNEMRDRLIELIVNADTYDPYECNLCTKDDDYCDCCYAEKLADDLVESGMILPPMKLKQICFNPYIYRNEIDECRVSSITQKADGTFKIRLTNLRGKWVFEITTDDIGKTVFLTREEAEKNLEEMKNNETTH